MTSASGVERGDLVDWARHARRSSSRIGTRTARDTTVPQQVGFETATTRRARCGTSVDEGGKAWRALLATTSTTGDGSDGAEFAARLGRDGIEVDLGTRTARLALARSVGKGDEVGSAGQATTSAGRVGTGRANRARVTELVRLETTGARQANTGSVGGRKESLLTRDADTSTRGEGTSSAESARGLGSTSCADSGSVLAGLALARSTVGGDAVGGAAHADASFSREGTRRADGAVGAIEVGLETARALDTLGSSRDVGDRTRRAELARSSILAKVTSVAELARKTISRDLGTNVASDALAGSSGDGNSVGGTSLARRSTLRVEANGADSAVRVIRGGLKTTRARETLCGSITARVRSLRARLAGVSVRRVGSSKTDGAVGGQGANETGLVTRAARDALASTLVERDGATDTLLTGLTTAG